MTFNQEKILNNMKTEPDDVGIIEEFETSKNVTEPLTGYQIRNTSISYPTINSHIGSEQNLSELLL